MQFTGHVRRGVIVPDKPVDLEESALVRMEVIAGPVSTNRDMPLAGTPFTFIDPDEPALSPEQWGELW
ncbi:MAG: hypothetical protein HYZ00_10185 [Candidatus Hydrogenedentes bacterium]|nr:hypothetical protein [Candidatus Hydrogenedentota bacterium]